MKKEFSEVIPSSDKLRKNETDGVGGNNMCVGEREKQNAVVGWEELSNKDNSEDVMQRLESMVQVQEPGVIIFKEGEAINADIDQGSSSYK